MGIVEGKEAGLGENLEHPIITNGDFAIWLFPNYFGQDLLMFTVCRSSVSSLALSVSCDLLLRYIFFYFLIVLGFLCFKEGSLLSFEVCSSVTCTSEGSNNFFPVTGHPSETMDSHWPLIWTCWNCLCACYMLLSLECCILELRLLQNCIELITVPPAVFIYSFARCLHLFIIDSSSSTFLFFCFYLV